MTKYYIHRDISQHTSMIEQQINMLTSEIIRVSRLSYASWENNAKIRTLDKQIEYLEHLLAAYERDQKKSI